MACGICLLLLELVPACLCVLASKRLDQKHLAFFGSLGFTVTGKGWPGGVATHPAACHPPTPSNQKKRGVFGALWLGFGATEKRAKIKISAGADHREERGEVLE